MKRTSLPLQILFAAVHESAVATKLEWAYRTQHIRSWGDSGRVGRTVGTTIFDPNVLPESI